MRIEIISDHLDRFEDDYGVAQEIAAQNESYENLLNDPDYAGVGEEFRDIVAEGLYDQQTNTVFLLANSGDDHQAYVDLAHVYNVTEAYVEQLANQYNTATSDADSYETRLRMLATKSIQISPNKEAEINKLLDQKIAQARHGNGQEILGNLVEQADKFNTIKELFDVAARPWPVPVIPNLNIEIDNRADEIDLVEDEMPVDPELTDVNNIDDEKVQRLCEKYGYTPNASVMTSAFLMENLGTILTPLEIGRIVYANNPEFVGMPMEKADKLKHNRTLSIMNPNSGTVIDMVMREGYFLQFGNRRFYSPTGKQIGPARRVYRIVNPADYVDGRPDRFFEDDDSLFDNLDIQTDISDAEYEDATTLEQIEEIERSVSMGRDERFNQRLDELLKSIDRILPWLDYNDMLPKEREGKVSLGHVSTRLMRLRASRKTQVPSEISSASVGSSQKDRKMSAKDVISYVTIGLQKPLSKDRSRLDEVAAAINERLDDYYLQKYELEAEKASVEN